MKLIDSLSIFYRIIPKDLWHLEFGTWEKGLNFKALDNLLLFTSLHIKKSVFGYRIVYSAWQNLANTFWIQAQLCNCFALIRCWLNLDFISGFKSTFYKNVLHFPTTQQILRYSLERFVRSLKVILLKESLKMKRPNNRDVWSNICPRWETIFFNICLVSLTSRNCPEKKKFFSIFCLIWWA